MRSGAVGRFNTDLDFPVIVDGGRHCAIGATDATNIPRRSTALPD
jgi:hypothetical protein